MRRAVLALAVLTGASACGQTGSLYLPDEQIETPVNGAEVIEAPF